MTDRRYAGRGVAITGAGSGLGAAMASVFAAQGAKLALFDIDETSLQAQAERLRAGGVEAYGQRVDVADTALLQTAATNLERRYGACHVFCVNVGVQQFEAIEALTEQDWQWVMSVNLHGVINSVAAFLPPLRRADGRTHVVLTSSASFFQIGIRMAASIASRYALVGYGEVLRRELAAEGLNVALLFPAGMATRHLESSVAARPAALGASRLGMDDMQAMMTDVGIDPAEHVATAEHAVRNLLDDLDAGHPYTTTHGDDRHQVEAQPARDACRLRPHGVPSMTCMQLEGSPR